jgi:branched-chain amino acid transport system ATP-binding protein
MLSVKNLDAWYGRAQILFGLNLDAARNEVVALIGRNGAGKSTTFKSIAGLLAKRTGQIVFDGHSILDSEPHEIARRGLAYVPEDRRIFKTLTVAENLATGRLPERGGVPLWTPDRLYEIFPNLAERKDTKAEGLSGGEQQMLTIARALMGNPKAVLLDEPSEGLAPVMVDKIAEVIDELKRSGMTIVMSEQNMHFALDVADRFYIIEKGHLVQEATSTMLRDDPNLSAAYLSM